LWVEGSSNQVNEFFPTLAHQGRRFLKLWDSFSEMSLEKRKVVEILIIAKNGGLQKD